MVRVGVEALGQAEVRLLDLRLVRAARDAEHLEVVRCPCSPSNASRSPGGAPPSPPVRRLLGVGSGRRRSGGGGAAARPRPPGSGRTGGFGLGGSGRNSTTPVQSRPNRLRCVSSVSSGDRLDHLARGEAAVDAREDVAVGRRQRDVLEAQQRVGGQAQDAVDVAERVAHDVRVLHAAVPRPG